MAVLSARTPAGPVAHRRICVRAVATRARAAWVWEPSTARLTLHGACTVPGCCAAYPRRIPPPTRT
eukprot:1634671-Lingulodinium_polyedra.AAC.1